MPVGFTKSKNINNIFTDIVDYIINVKILNDKHYKQKIHQYIRLVNVKCKLFEIGYLY